MSSAMTQLDRFYPIFDSYDWLERLVPLGIKLVQLRIKDESQERIKAQIVEAKALCYQYDCQLVINDYWQLAIELGCDYVHLGQEDLDVADIEAIKSAGIKLGISTHCEEELERALALNPDYIALGPVYPTILKKMKWHQQGVEKLTLWKAQIGQIPLIAIGGMTIERSKGAFEAKADSVAAVTDITLNQNPERQVQAWLAATR
ncbi:thiamine-phosphate pyrophosphorylase [Marinomonas sp. MED121]|uniref:thiamine phosphate synthase n=1 Tax=Marinomonas sp. MED121 TaxID=314277 RepID=UPI0000690ABB|nr:thiamine phosphate synthase [Marinomonas sp. MED121]EAQ65864.1 thiamine-phosphate pyrophosphorylase [Marinomonas sp. MED121]